MLWTLLLYTYSASQVLDAVTLRPLAGVRVSLEKSRNETQQHVTAADGSFPQWKEARKVHLYKDGYVQVPTEGLWAYGGADFHPNLNANYFRMYKLVQAAGRFVDARGKPVEGVEVTIRPAKPLLGWRKSPEEIEGGIYHSDKRGRFAATLAQIDYVIEFPGPDGVRKQEPLSLREGLRFITSRQQTGKLTVSITQDRELARDGRVVVFTKRQGDRGRPKQWPAPGAISLAPGDYAIDARWESRCVSDVCDQVGFGWHRDVRIVAGREHALAFAFHKPVSDAMAKLTWPAGEVGCPAGLLSVASRQFSLRGCPSTIPLPWFVLGDNVAIVAPGVGIRRVRWNGAEVDPQNVSMKVEDAVRVLEIEFGPGPPAVPPDRAAFQVQDSWRMVTSTPLLIAVDPARRGAPLATGRYKVFQFEPALLPTEDAEPLVRQFWEQATEVELINGKEVQAAVRVIKRI